ncbi:DUF2894 domain-containing protein [Bordetella avium]|uniref:DUF2894 domain-containing protein n=7 Tax=Bordetella avium TaxID=521 RepID=UPI000E19AA59|nr:DUF2894 domain-containing protein [Bordetella avium]WQE32938.1 DUF2894 domain-containing protein [Bordetella avium]SUV69861.1 Protein of uncharacterised function (DUF2894) [Bordetella avium]
MTERLQRWREQGADRLDPCGFARLEALARRVQALAGGAREAAQAHLARHLDDYAARLAAVQAAPAAPETPPLSELQALLAHIAERPAGLDHSLREHYPDLPLLDSFRALWTRLSADQQLRQSMAQLPENAGPLNADHLAHRALSHMRALSPDYLYQFMSYVETLSWLERLTAPAPPKEPRRARKPRS